MGQHEVALPEFINPATLAEMEPEQYELLLENIRKRRLVAASTVRNVRERVAKVSDDPQEALDKLVNRFDVKFQKMEKDLEALDNLVLKIRVKQLELGLD